MSHPTGAVRLGIDFGSTHTVAVLESSDGRSQPLLFDSSPLLSSGVYAEPDGRLLTGRDGERSAGLDPTRYEPNPKRRVDERSVLLGTDEYPVTQVIGAVLTRVAGEAYRAGGRSPDQTVLTYPATWAASRKGVLVQAAAAAGLANPTLVPEPVAAAAHFTGVLGHSVPPGGWLAIYDFGAGTFDASVVRRGADGGWSLVAFEGVTDLGGLDLDDVLVGRIAATVGANDRDKWHRLTNPATAADRRASRTFWTDVRSAKEQLSRTSSAAVHVPLFDVDTHLTRQEFEEVARPLLTRTVDVQAALLGQARCHPSQLSGLYLVGGSSRIPLVATLLHQRLGVAPVLLDQPELLVAAGSLRTVAPPPGFGAPGAIAGAAPGAAAAVSGPPAGQVSGVPAGPVSGMPAGPISGAPGGPISGAPGGPVSGAPAVPTSGPPVDQTSGAIPGLGSPASGAAAGGPGGMLWPGAPQQQAQPLWGGPGGPTAIPGTAPGYPAAPGAGAPSGPGGFGAPGAGASGAASGGFPGGPGAFPGGSGNGGGPGGAFPGAAGSGSGFPGGAGSGGAESGGVLAGMDARRTGRRSGRSRGKVLIGAVLALIVLLGAGGTYAMTKLGGDDDPAKSGLEAGRGDGRGAEPPAGKLSVGPSGAQQLTLNKTVWYAGKKITVKTVAYDPADQSQPVKIDVTLENLDDENDGQAANTDAYLSSEGQITNGRLRDVSALPGKQTVNGVFTFDPSKPITDLRKAQLTIGENNTVQAVVPFGDPGKATVLEPKQVAGASPEKRTGVLGFTVQGCEQRADFPHEHRQARKDSYYLVCRFDVKSYKESIYDHGVWEGNFRLKIPDGTVVAPDRFDSVLLNQGEQERNVYVAFMIRWPAPGAYVFQYFDAGRLGNEQPVGGEIGEVPVTLG
ncbi:Hsp70 family protein [Virgisporangium aliadipatigenens]|uniref:Hsp70 family protein n=1 Tax=Virgisporangium aliadipatigenens TaxID=741659 RepID=UPI0019406D20|nr:Hsp70 family protein [Virgisporangium aliadipatigenens]